MRRKVVHFGYFCVMKMLIFVHYCRFNPGFAVEQRTHAGLMERMAVDVYVLGFKFTLNLLNYVRIVTHNESNKDATVCISYDQQMLNDFQIFFHITLGNKFQTYFQ